MSERADGSAGDVDYGVAGAVYSRFRQADPRIAAFVDEALGTARTVLNVGAGAGSYEPVGRRVTAVEPSATMRAQRSAHLAPAIDAVAEELPFDDREFDAGMTTFSIHQWNDVATGLHEMRRVTRGPVVVLTADPTLLDRFWLVDYAPAVIETEARRHPSLGTISEVLPDLRVSGVPIPLDCLDGFNEAYYGRPEMLLDPLARAACSAWTFVDPETTAGYAQRLADDLAAGVWDRRHRRLRSQPTFVGSLVLAVSPGESL